MSDIYEPPINPDDDTSPSLAMRPIDLDKHLNPPSWQTALGWLSLLGAALLTVATIVILLLPQAETDTALPEIVSEPTNIAQAPTGVNTEIAATIPTSVDMVPETSTTNELVDELAPEIAPQQLTELLQSPIAVAASNGTTFQYDPFTIISGNRPRSEFLQYTAVQGDTINTVAERYNLESESIAWCNDRRIILVLRPTDVLQIPPVDGVCHRVLGTREETVSQIAAQYQITDPYMIIDSPYNYPNLVGVAPDDVLPGGKNVFIPGGQGESITWNPGRAEERNADGSVSRVTFAPGQPGSCGAVEPSGGTFWANPLPNGTWVRGFYAGHTGLDLAAPTGTPVRAANGGRVIFAGWSRWGYGNAVVIEHGGVLSTLYGHMSSISASCGQFVNAGDVIGAVGSTGNSSGPHLHFEIRNGSSPYNPSGTPGIGW
ncbi:MAG: M23 family metallopeptidase [Anaerolineae bacterium]|nr:M23 family metallopeptidase [Anaerolineae bacterium]MDQ7036320.1 M23 family metallopeptidase [Anaerolineae bacterium]